MEDHPVEGALFERAVMQCFHAIAMNASGEVTGSNWGSFPATRQIWMKDMYYAFLPFCILEPDLAWKGMEWFINYGIRPEGDKCRGGVTHSLGNSLAGILLAGITFENTGKAEILKIDRKFSKNLWILWIRWSVQRMITIVYIHVLGFRMHWH